MTNTLDGQSEQDADQMIQDDVDANTAAQAECDACMI